MGTTPKKKDERLNQVDEKLNDIIKFFKDLKKQVSRIEAELEERK